MTQYSILVNKRGTILSMEVKNADSTKLPVNKIKGRHFSRIAGFDCRKYLRLIMEQTSKSQEPTVFQTFFLVTGVAQNQIVEWTILPRTNHANHLLDKFIPTKYLLVGKCA